MKIYHLIQRKLRIVGCVFLFFNVSMIYPQQRLKVPEMSVGFHGGVVASMVIFNPEVIASRHFTDMFILGGNGGFVFRYLGNKVCGFLVELNYIQRGWREHSNDTIENVNYKRHLHYIEIPFLTHIYLGNEKFNFIFNLGPQIGFCFLEKSFGTPQTRTTLQYDKITHPFDWGVVGGLGFLYNTIKKNSLLFEIRFTYSFGYLFDNSATSFFSASNPITLSANIGWLWSVKKKNDNKKLKHINKI